MQRSTTCVGRSENLDRTLENLYLLYRGRLLRAGDAARLLDRIETLLPYLLGDRPNQVPLLRTVIRPHRVPLLNQAPLLNRNQV